MNVTRDVIRDLLPVYYSGEASGDTKSLVDEFLRTDPTFAALVKRGERAAEQLAAQPEAAAPNEAAAFNATKRALRRRTTLLSLALLFTVWPLSFSFGEHGVSFFFKDTPAVALAMWIAAGAFWLAYRGQRRLTRAAEI